MDEELVYIWRLPRKPEDDALGLYTYGEASVKLGLSARNIKIMLDKYCHFDTDKYHVETEY